MRINPIDPIYRHTKRFRENDRDFLAWLRKQKSAVSGKTPCIAAHYRTAANSGTGIKPLFSAIPLTAEEHNHQHQIGQFNFMPKEIWERLVATYVAKYHEENPR